MSFFDQEYDKMSLEKVCCRVPSELAINSIKRRVNDIVSLKELVEHTDHACRKCRDLEKHINDIVDETYIDDIMKEFNEDNFSNLFPWLNDDNLARIKNFDKDRLSIKLSFNFCDKDDIDGLSNVLKRILEDKEFRTGYACAVLRKCSSKNLDRLISMIIKDSRLEVQCCALYCLNFKKFDEDTDMGWSVKALRAFAKCKSDKPIPGVFGAWSVNIFEGIGPLDRIKALEKYLGYMPQGRKIHAFHEKIDDDHFNRLIFPCYIRYNKIFSRVNDLYNKITNYDPLKEKEKNNG